MTDIIHQRTWYVGKGKEKNGNYWKLWRGKTKDRKEDLENIEYHGHATEPENVTLQPLVL